jgi:prepilin-type N-terminal cleavage/methylation domain-containing protein/prepilin-type processing-associated H-X9-DG protein
MCPVPARAESSRAERLPLRGFTLIELLVVISIISLLAGILLPSLSKARAIGKSAACKGNLHAAGSAFQMYLNDNNDVMPYAAGMATVNTEGRALLVDVLGPNLSAPEVLLCPDDTDKYVFLKEGSSYYYNFSLYNEGKQYYDTSGNHHLQHMLENGGEVNVDVLMDCDDEENHKKFHEGAGGKNFLYLDWHVTE